MRQTTYGATHKIEIHESSSIRKFLEKNKSLINDKNLKDCIYKNKKVISSEALNFLNLQDTSKLDNQLKFLIRSAYDECEKTYPYLGDVFINNFFNSNLVGDYKTFKFKKQNEEKFINTIENNTVKSISQWFFKNISNERLITIEKTKLDEIVIESNDEVNFKLSYDNDFLAGKFYHEMKNYKVVIVDGFIESVGEIHHFLYNAAETKIPHVLFCFGMSEEVKHTIITNNNKAITEIFPVVMGLDNETANILNDIAVLHKSDVISALKGQTISQAVRNNLSEGKKITFFKDGIVIDPICTNEDMIMHRKFLLRRINNAPAGTDKTPISKRLKNFSSKSTKVYIPERYFNNIQFMRELDYFFTFLNSLSHELVEYAGKIYPFEAFDNVQKKINSLTNTYHNIDKAVIMSRRS